MAGRVTAPGRLGQNRVIVVLRDDRISNYAIG
jgi:hypothetical protein